MGECRREGFTLVHAIVAIHQKRLLFLVSLQRMRGSARVQACIEPSLLTTVTGLQQFIFQSPWRNAHYSSE
jgi:hypothetical protein